MRVRTYIPHKSHFTRKRYRFTIFSSFFSRSRASERTGRAHDGARFKRGGVFNSVWRSALFGYTRDASTERIWTSGGMNTQRL